MLIGIVTAIRPETRAVLRGLSTVRRSRDGVGSVWRGRADAAEVIVLQSGVGPTRAQAATCRFVSPPDIVLSVGFAGALRGHVSVGTLIVSARVVWEEAGGAATYEVPSRLVAALRESAGGTLLEGPLLSSPVVLPTTAAKAAAGQHYGAAAVEMEAVSLARYAVQHGIPFLPVRAVLDPMELSLVDLPDEIGSSWAARARLVVTPGLWPKLRVLRSHALQATDVLATVTARLLRRLARSE